MHHRCPGQDWWNATTIGDYWRLWNMPVHKWLLRHVYYPALRLGMGRTPAMVLVFFVSACFHELLIGWPLHMIRGWAFVGVMGQVSNPALGLRCPAVLGKGSGAVASIVQKPLSAAGVRCWSPQSCMPKRMRSGISCNLFSADAPGRYLFQMSLSQLELWPPWSWTVWTGSCPYSLLALRWP